MSSNAEAIEIVKRFPPSHISADTVRIIRRLESAKIGDVITYQELGSLIGAGVSPGNPGYSKLATAKRVLLRERGMVFGAVLNQGVKRLNDSEIVDDTHNGIRRLRRMNIRQELKLASVDDRRLNEHDRVRANCMRTLLAFNRDIFSKKRIGMIENQVKSENTRLSLEDTLKLFKK